MILEVQIKQPAGGSTKTLRFAKSPVRIGRNQLNDISLEDPFTSEWHGIIRFDDQSIAYFDLGSTNGSLLDGKRVTKNAAATLSEASKLQVGMLEIRVVRHPDEPKAAEPPPKREDSGPLKTLGWGQMTPAVGTPRPPDVFSGARVEADARRAPAAAPGAPQPAPTPPPPGLLPPDPSLPPAARPAPPSQQPVAGVAAELVARQAKLIEAFSEAFVGLRKGYEQFGAEVGIRTVSGSTPLHRARTSRELLDHLLHPQVDPAVATRDLIAIFADLGIHHIALMEGITEGVRAVLQSMDPRANDLEAGSGLFTGSKAKNQWKRYLERFDQLVTDDEELHAVIFGDAFARAYAMVTLGDGRDTKDGQ
jgi:type VI secretion system protein ImpI